MLKISGECPPTLLRQIQENKPGVLCALILEEGVAAEVIPAIALPLVPGGLSVGRDDKNRLIERVMRQFGPNRPCPIEVWANKRADAYYEGPGRSWDCLDHEYAACRDLLAWQMKCDPEEVPARIPVERGD